FRRAPWSSTAGGKLCEIVSLRFSFAADSGAKLPLRNTVLIAPYSFERRSYCNLLFDFQHINEETLPRHYWYSAGSDAELKVSANATTDDNVSGALRVSYTIKSGDSGKNWVVLRHHDLSSPLDASKYSGVELWLKSDGRGGLFRVDLENADGSVASFRDELILNQKKWHHLQIEFGKFQGAVSLVKAFSFYIGLDWHQAPLSGEAFFHDLRRKGEKALTVERNVYLGNISDRITERAKELLLATMDVEKCVSLESALITNKIEEYYYHRTGAEAEIAYESCVEALRTERLSSGARILLMRGFSLPSFVPGVRVKYAITGRDSKENYCELRRYRLAESVVIPEGGSVGFFLRSEGSGGVLRLILEAADGSEWVSEHRLALRTRHWHYWQARAVDFRRAPWSSTAGGKLCEIVSLRFSFAADSGAKLPLRNTVLIAPHTFSSRDYLNLLWDLPEINEVTLPRSYWFGSGADAEFKVFPNIVTDGLAGGALKAAFRIKSGDSGKNWVVLRHQDFPRPVFAGEHQGVELWLKSDGRGGLFRIDLLQEDGTICSFRNEQVLNQKRWHHLQIPFQKFSGKPVKLISFSFYIGLDWHRPPLDGEIILHNFRSRLEKTGLSEEKIYLNLFEDFETGTDELADKFWWASGEDSSLSVTPMVTDPQGVQNCLRINYRIESPDFEKNWIVIKHNDYSEPQNLTFADGVSLWVKGDGQGGHFRIKLVDNDKNEFIHSDRKILNTTKWQQLKISFDKFIAGKPGFDLKKVASFELYLGLDWKKPPLSGTVYFNDFRRQKEQPIAIGRGDFQSFHSAQVSEKYESLAYRFLSSSLIPKRQVHFGGKLINFTEYEGLIRQKHPHVDDLKRRNFIAFNEKDTVILDSMRKNRWGLDKVALFIEPTNLCNLQCIMCNHGDHSFQRPLGVMKLSEFKRIIDEIVAEKLNLWEFAPFWLGESFVHPQIVDFLNYASEAKTRPGTFRHFNIHTNGSMLERQHLDAILNSKLTSILFSVDAATKGTYEKIRVGGNFERVVSNLHFLLSERIKRGQASPKLIAQLIGMDENIGEIRAFADYWLSAGFEDLIFAGRAEDNPFPRETKVHLLFPQVIRDSVFIKALEPNALTKHQCHREVIEMHPGLVRKPCGSLWRMLSVAWDGTATACCRDDQIKMPIGNVLKSSLKEVWYGEPLRRLRIAQIMGNFSETPKCLDCVNWVKYPLSREEVADYLRSIGEDRLINHFSRLSHA
ncbi:MAG: CIA30 family protein, partial [Candidatus Wallbacteria bacterium]|nr:CIA30 family protein [Candidatus Wallbacteria bacterium]